MEDEASASLDGKALGNLRVVDLKQELEKRSLSKSGSKKDLVKRLKQQLEFEKLCDERNSTGDCDLKLELDADTGQNEYPTQQQNMHAEQKEMQHLIENEEIEKSSDERSSDSSKEDDASDQETQPEERSDSESAVETGNERGQIVSAFHVDGKEKSEKVKGIILKIRREKPEIDSENNRDKEVRNDNESRVDINREKTDIKSLKSEESGTKKFSVEIIDKKEIWSVNIVGESKSKSSSVPSCTSSSSEHDEKIQNQKFSEKQSNQDILSSNIVKHHPSSEDSSETAKSVVQNQVLDMEPATKLSSVPYSLSDIQLPESPGNIMKPAPNSIPEEGGDQQVIGNKKIHSGTVKVEPDSSSSDEDPVSEKQASEQETSTLNGECPPKKEKAVFQSVNSNNDQETVIKEEQSEPPQSDSVSEVCEKGTSSDHKDSKVSEGSEEGEMKSESASEESSDSNEDRHGRMKSRKVRRKRDRRHKSRTSDSGGSRSRESSFEKATKRDRQSDVVDKRTDAERISVRSDAPSASRSADSNVQEYTSSRRFKEPPSHRLKLKRDNVVISDTSLSTKKDSSSVSSVSEESNSKGQNSDRVLPTSPTNEPKKAKITEPIEVQPVPKYVSTRKIRLSSRKVSEKPEDEPKSKKGKWGSFSNSQKSSQAINISTDSLKNWFPDFKLLKNPETVSEAVCEESPLPVKEESRMEIKTEKIDDSNNDSLSIAAEDEARGNEQSENQPFDSGVASKILFIQNLVRPFTLHQLKELLKDTGNFNEEKFWIDKIKSKCFVMYETEEEAIKTRNALNGSRWPSSNPKILSVEFSTEEELNFHQSGSEPPKPVPPRPSTEMVESREDRTLHPAADYRKKDREQERKRERSKQPVREWDKDKITQDSPGREHISSNAEKFKPSDKRDKKDSKRRPNEDTPAKLLDDLFQKTKSSPCIYWLPLTEERVLEREEAKRLRRAEREKRNQQREQEETEHKSKRPQSSHRTRETETRRSSTRSRSPVSRRR